MVSFLKKVKVERILGLIFPILLAAIGIFLSLKNYSPGTWLTGWDNLHPEFNLGLNIRRSFSAVWQEYQGLGLLGGMAHASDLPRQLILLIVSLFLPSEFLRYFWTFLMLIIGPLGVYFLFGSLINKEVNKFLALSSAFLAGVFYLNNLATVQYFYTPYEAFVSFYGFLPWLLFFALGYLKSRRNRDLMIFALVSILATCSFYVQTLFLVFMVCLLVFIVEHIVRYKKSGFINSFKLLVVTLLTNSFWLLPAMYFTFASPDLVTASKINSFSTPEIKLFNEARGNVGDIAMLKGFWFEYTDMNPSGKFEYLMEDWRSYVGKQEVQYIAYILFAFSSLGLISAVFLKDNNFKITPILLFFTSLFMLASTNPPLGSLYKYLTDNVAFIGNALRSVFTKWSIPAGLSYSLGIGFFVYKVGMYLKGKLRFLATVPIILIAVLTFIVVKPAYGGKLIHKYLKVKIPQSYFELFDYFKNQPKDARISYFPLQTFWGWNFSDWGYRGSGFLWYGIEQPILDRAFDVWSNFDEGYYNEASDALYSGNLDRFVTVLKKYNVNYLLVDKSVTFYGVDRKYLKFDEIEKYFKEKGYDSVFEKEFIKVYKVGDLGYMKNIKTSGFGEDGSTVRRDEKYHLIGNYYEKTGLISSFPFSNLTSEQANVSYKDGINNGTWVHLEADIIESGKYSLNLPAYGFGDEIIIPARVKLEKNELFVYFDSNIKLSNLDVDTPKLPDLKLKSPKVVNTAYVSISGNIFQIKQNEEKNVALKLKVGTDIVLYLFDETRPQKMTLEESFLDKKVNKCWNREGVEGVLSVAKNQDGFLSIETKDAAGCFSFKLGKMNTIKVGLMDVRLPFRSFSGSKPHFCVIGEGPVYKCENDDVFYNELPSRDWTEVQRKLILDGSKIYWIDIAAKPSDQAGDAWRIDYKEPYAISYPIAAFYTFDANVWEKLTTPTNLEINSESKALGLDVFSSRLEADFAKGGRISAYNCDVFKRGTVGKELDKGSSIYISNGSGANCDFVPLNTLLTKNSYILRFIGQGLQGRGLKFYLYNKASSRNDIELLLGQGRYDKSFGVLNWPSLDEKSYVLNVENRSFGGQAKDILESIFVYQIPLSWISKIGINNFGVTDYANGMDVEYKKTGTFKYVTSGNIPLDIIELSQGYDKGWSAYEIGSRPSAIGRQLSVVTPWLFGQKLEHVKVNGWANGWLVEPSAISHQPLVNTNTSNSIVIVFWPQYLEYLGFILLAVTGVFLVFPVKKTN